MRRLGIGGAAIASAAVVAALATGLGNAAASASTHARVAAGNPFGKMHKATKSPYVFGLINDETGPVTFPEVRLAMDAAAEYVNTYQDGINGHPIKLVNCIGDTTGPTAARCANELLSKHPMAILGAADAGNAASVPIYKRAGLAFIGGIPFTPVEQNASNAVIFNSQSVGDNAAAAVFAAKYLKAKTASVLYFADSQGEVAGLHIIPPVLKAAGVTSVNAVGIPDSTPDPSSEVAQAVSTHPDVIYVDAPNNCGVILKDIKSLGYTGKLVGISLCASPPEIASAAGGAQGMWVATPYELSGKQFNLFIAGMKKWAPANTALDGLAQMGFNTIINTQQMLSTIKGKPTTKSILKAFKTGSNHPSFLSHPYTCDGKQLAKASAICDDHYLLARVSGTNLVVPHPNQWVTSKGYFKGL